MGHDYTEYLRLLKTQLWYFENLLSKRNTHSNEAMDTPISSLWDTGESQSPLELAYHAVSPLNQISEILTNKKLEWGDVEIHPIPDHSPSDEFIALYRLVIEKAERNLKNVELDNFTGNMAEFNDPETLEKFEKRLEIFCMHAMTHMGQAIKFQGLICLALAEEDDSDINE